MFYKVHSEILKFNFPSMIKVTMQSEKYAKKKKLQIISITNRQKRFSRFTHYRVTWYSEWGVYDNHSNIIEKGRFEQHASNY